MHLISGFLLGLSSTPACFGVCAPVFVPYLLGSGGPAARPVTLFLLGRLAAYLLFGFFAGSLGYYFDGRLDPRIVSALTAVLALWLILFALGSGIASVPLCRRLETTVSGRHLPLYLGFVMGVNLCPPFLLGVSEAAATGSMLASVVFFIGFFGGSSLWVGLLLFGGTLERTETVRRAGALLALVVGVLYFVRGLIGILR